jgi:decaprenylphospho-beta-D-erythro-pentofuranosid-2-ulose 2-reductase
MDDAFGNPSSVVLLGGTSEIGQAIVDRLAVRPDGRVVLAVREVGATTEFIERLQGRGVRVTEHLFDAADTATHEAFVDDVSAHLGDIDVAVIAFGVLGHGQGVDTPSTDAVAQVTVNYVGAVSVGLALARRMRTQGHGRIVVLSSVAGERVRKSNFVYGSAKAGLDGFAQGLSDALVGTGVSVLVVRPGFVRSRMTHGLEPAPFSTTPEVVADVVVAGLRRGRHTVWAPPVLRPLFTVLRHLPRLAWRRLPF